jgi:hypothetical protein
MSNQKSRTLKDKARKLIVIAEASAIRESAEALFEAAGKEVLSDGAKEAIKETVGKITQKGSEATAKATIAQFAESAGRTLAKTAGKEGAKEATKTVVKESAKQVCIGIGRAAGLGGGIDFVIGTGEGLLKWKKGQLSGRRACAHACKEAGTGAVSSVAGVAATAGLIILTGPVSAPLAAGVAIAASIGTKSGLNFLLG